MEQQNRKTIIVVSDNGMGNGHPDLNQVLINNYFSLLIDENFVPAYICFYNEGVKLTCTGSLVLDKLQAIEEKGCKLLICKTCLSYFNLLDKVQAGIIGTMSDIINIQKTSQKVIKL